MEVGVAINLVGSAWDQLHKAGEENYNKEVDIFQDQLRKNKRDLNEKQVGNIINKIKVKQSRLSGTARKISTSGKIVGVVFSLIIILLLGLVGVNPSFRVGALCLLFFSVILIGAVPCIMWYLKRFWNKNLRRLMDEEEENYLGTLDESDVDMILEGMKDKRKSRPG